MADINPTNIINHSDAGTRKTQRLCQEQIRHQVLFDSFTPALCQNWNRLPISITSALSMESFQARLRCGLHNLQPFAATPWTSDEIYIVLASIKFSMLQTTFKYILVPRCSSRHDEQHMFTTPLAENTATTTVARLITDGKEYNNDGSILCKKKSKKKNCTAATIMSNKWW